MKAFSEAEAIECVYTLVFAVAGLWKGCEESVCSWAIVIWLRWRDELEDWGWGSMELILNNDFLLRAKNIIFDLHITCSEAEYDILKSISSKLSLRGMKFSFSLYFLISIIQVAPLLKNTQKTIQANNIQTNHSLISAIFADIRLI